MAAKYSGAVVHEKVRGKSPRTCGPDQRSALVRSAVAGGKKSPVRGRKQTAGPRPNAPKRGDADYIWKSADQLQNFPPAAHIETETIKETVKRAQKSFGGRFWRLFALGPRTFVHGLHADFPRSAPKRTGPRTGLAHVSSRPEVRQKSGPRSQTHYLVRAAAGTGVSKSGPRNITKSS